VKRRYQLDLFEPLNIPNFRRYFVGQAISKLGDRLVPVAVAFAVLDQTHSVTDLSIVLVSDTLTQLVFLLAGGVLADRVSRRWLMLWSEFLEMLGTGALGLLFIMGRPSIPLICVAGAIQGLAGAMFLPASAGLLPALAGPNQLRRANTLNQIASSATSVAGPAIAGILVTTVGPGWAILGDAISFLPGIVSLARLDVVHLPRASKVSWLADFRQGWTEFSGRTWLWSITAGAAIFNCAYGMFVVLGPVASVRYYSGASTWATVSAVGAVGSVIGGFLTSRFDPEHPMRWAIPAASCFALAPLSIAIGLPVAVIAASAAIGSTGLLIFTSLYKTSVQRSLPADVLSRVSSYDWFGSLIAFPIGLAVAGPLDEVVRLKPALFFVSAISLISLMTLLLVRSVRNLKIKESSLEPS